MEKRAADRAPIAVFAVLITATIVMWWTGEHHWLEKQAAATLILAIAFTKIYLVMLYFMELRSAPKIWSLVFGAWCTGAFILLALLYRP